MWTERNELASPFTRARVLALAFVVTACGGAQRTETHALQPLPESRALEVIVEAYRQVGVEPEFHRRIQLQGGREMEIDVATQGHDHGVEFVQAQDRADFGASLPQRRTEGSLLTLTGVGPDAAVDVLLLDDREFMYEPEVEHAGAGRPTMLEVEDRLRRAVVDYLTYLRTHGQL